MTEPPPDPIAALLDTARRARQNGDIAGARALLHAITARRPGDVRGWLLLATVAADRAEQRHALERALVIDPANRAARRALDSIAARQTPTKPVPAITPPVAVAAPPSEEVEPAAEAGERGDAVRWPLYVVLGVAALTLAAAAFIVWRPQTQQAQVSASMPSSTSVLNGIEASGVTVEAAPTLIATEPPTVEPIFTTAPEPGATPIAEPTAEPSPGPSATPAIGFARFQQQGTWVFSLLKPTDAVVLSGSIGQLQPQGRFVLALVAVGNQSNGDRQLPVDLLTLLDNQGNRYTAQPAASSAYLQAYGEGQAGVVSMESAIAPGGALVSVPLIFDVSESARGLQLTVNGANEGWKVGE